MCAPIHIHPQHLLLSHDHLCPQTNPLHDHLDHRRHHWYHHHHHHHTTTPKTTTTTTITTITTTTTTPLRDGFNGSTSMMHEDVQHFPTGGLGNKSPGGSSANVWRWTNVACPQDGPTGPPCQRSLHVAR